MLNRGINIGSSRDMGDPIDPDVIKMLQYSSKTFQRVDDNFFEGLEVALKKLSEYVIKRKYVDYSRKPRYKEGINHWQLAEVDKSNNVERIQTKEPWMEKSSFLELPPDSDYLPAGKNRKDDSKKLIWEKGYISMESKIQALKREIKIEKIPDIIEDFYSGIGQMYGEMAHNELRNAKLTVPMEWYNNQEDRIFSIVKTEKKDRFFSQEEARSTNIPIAGNATTATIMVHELMHRLITANDEVSPYFPEQLKETERYKLGEKTPDFISSLILSETCSIYVEQLFTDYLIQKYPTADVTSFLKKFRLADFAAFKGTPPERIRNLGQLLRYSKQYEKHNNLADAKLEEITSFVRSNDEWEYGKELPESFVQLMLFRYTHTMGYMYASYLHEKTLKGELNPQDVLDKCTSAFVLSNSDEEKQMELLSEIGAPFIKDGKFVMDEEAIQTLYDASVNNMDRVFETAKKRRSLAGIKEAIKNRGKDKEL